MTVAEIKERIDEREKTYIKFAKRKESLNPKLFVGELEVIKSMLDELGDIKEYINKRIKECDEEYENHDRIYGLCLDHRDVSNELEKVRDMLDELKENNK